MQRLPRLHELPASAPATSSSSPSQLLSAAAENEALAAPPQQQQQQPLSNYAEMPAFLASMVDFNGQSAADGLFPFTQHADYHSQQQQPSHPFAASLDPTWDPFPAPITFSNNNSATSGLEQQQFARRPSFSDFMRLRGEPRYPDRATAMSRIAAAQALRLFLPATPGPPQQIDLTLSSSDSDSDADSDPGSHRRTSSAGDASSYDVGDTPDEDDENEDDDDDGEVEILQTRGAASPSAAARYLTYASVPPLRRKRRRVESAGAVKDDEPVDRERFNGKRAESTSISMENNEVIERFKKALKCSICLDVIEEMTSTICGHVYCGKCIRAAIRVTAKCPLCQRRLRPKDTHLLYF